MSILVVILLAVIVIVIAMRLHVSVGGAILAGGLTMWLCVDRSPATLAASLMETLKASRTYDLIFSLYFVMCLESALRLSKTLDGMVAALNRLFSSARVTAAVMPAFLGLLPSMGGALFSAPIVAEGCRGMKIPAEVKASVNYWFRHVFEAGSPTIPGMILACAIAGVPLSDLVVHLLAFSLAFALIGWVVLLMPYKSEDQAAAPVENGHRMTEDILNVVLAVSPVVVNVVLMMLFDMSAAPAMGAAVAILVLTLAVLKRPVPLLKILTGSINWKLFLNVSCILYFISLLTLSSVLDQLVAELRAAPLPVPVIFSLLSLLIGALTGMSQAFIAIVMPIAAGIATGSVHYAGLAMVFGLAGQMLTPVHLCFTISVNYFEASFSGVFRRIFLCTTLSLIFYAGYAWLLWA